MELITSEEVAARLGVNKQHVMYIKHAYNIEGTMKKPENWNFKKIYFSEEEFLKIKEISEIINKKKKHSSPEDKSKYCIVYHKVGGVNELYEIFSIKNKMPKFEGIVNLAKLLEIKSKIKMVEI